MALLNLLHRVFKSDKQNNTDNMYVGDEKFIDLIQKLSKEQLVASVSHYDPSEIHFYDIEKSSIGPIMISYSDYCFEEEMPYIQMQIPELQYDDYVFDRGIFNRTAFNEGKSFIKHKLIKQKSTLTPYEMLSKSVHFMDPKEKQIAREEQYLKARVVYSVIKDLIVDGSYITVRNDKTGSEFSLLDNGKKFMTFQFIGKFYPLSVKIEIPSINMIGVFKDMCGTEDEFIFNMAKRYLEYLQGKLPVAAIMSGTFHIQKPESMFSFNDEKYINTMAKIIASRRQVRTK